MQLTQLNAYLSYQNYIFPFVNSIGTNISEKLFLTINILIFDNTFSLCKVLTIIISNSTSIWSINQFSGDPVFRYI